MSIRRPVSFRLLSVTSVSLLILLLSMPCLWGQTGNGIIKGTVLDQARALVPGAQVTITNANTGITRTAQSNETGIFYFGAIQPGPYTVTVELTGFSKWTTKVDLQVGATEVLEAVLAIGNVSNTVEVNTS